METLNAELSTPVLVGSIDKDNWSPVMFECAVADLLKEFLRRVEQYEMLVLIACRLDHSALRSDVSLLSEPLARSIPGSYNGLQKMMSAWH